ncbi:hypothetical protein AVEN_159713-1 [Araneus ventricosus]|uniref:Uncharacterized protein n=1 Tax=Araneus ventricosus TaxID=182803 RepID=A0A4Y2JCB8_ARAVE|nr:hypothetical protein AVEN_159713-1 [Araneus ventricosus]
MEDGSILRDQQMFVFDWLFDQEQRKNENREEANGLRDATSGCLGRRIQVKESFQACSVESGSPSKQRRSSSKSSLALQSTPESTKQESSSSDNSHRKESTEIKP